MDRTLVERAQHGDPAAFEALAAAALPRLWSIARRVLTDHDAAEDAVQDCLVRAWRDLRALRDADRFDAWLYRLLINACRDRKRIAPRVGVMPIDDLPDLVAPGDAMAGADLRDELSRAFRGLSMEHRAALVLHHYVGLRAREMAVVLGIPEGTVVSRLHYASAAMRTELEAGMRLVPATATGDHR
jgi:RNA polymerase sigma-70 factor, ECF subfamily